MARSGRFRHRARRIAAGMLMTALTAAAGCIDPEPTPPPTPAPALRIAAGDRLKIGTAVEGTTSSRGLADEEYTRILGAEFSSVTPENQMKWGILQPSRGTWDFGPADEVVAFARENGQTVRGHTLLWHGGNPSWVTDPGMGCDELRGVVRQHISTVVGRYRGSVSQWDVVNEVFDENGQPRQENPFVAACGMGIVADAFRWANAADPDARLFLNDYGAEGINARSDAYYRLVQELLAQGVPVHGYGVQAHLQLKSGVPASMGRNLARFAAQGLEVAVTEADVRLDWNPGERVAPDRSAAQAAVYGQLIDVCLNQPACRSFTVWGFTDRYSWLPEGIEGEGSAAIMTDQYLRKPAFDELARRLEAAR